MVKDWNSRKYVSYLWNRSCCGSPGRGLASGLGYIIAKGIYMLGQTPQGGLQHDLLTLKYVENMHTKMHNIFNVHDAVIKIYHLDFNRIQGPQEMHDIFSNCPDVFCMETIYSIS